jgi:predicted LPLAT superfamily acyltransferase
LADFSTHPEKRFGASSTDAIDPEQQIREAVERYAARLEALCRESPFNWFNFYDFWDET